MVGGGVTVLGISADYHDAAAALVVDGQLVAASEEERFSRRKHDPSLPRNAVDFCLRAGGVEPGGLDLVVFYDKPLTTYERILATHAKVGPRGFPTLSRAVSTWSRSKLWVGARIENLLEELGHTGTEVAYSEHHLSHAASAFYPSPFASAAVLTFDGVGEWATSSICHGTGAELEMLEELRFPDSTGLFYSAMTAFCGFEVNDGEYKLMGLAPYGQPRFADVLRDEVLDIARDGSVRVRQRYFAYRAGRRMTSRRLSDLLDGPALALGGPQGQREADIARSTQVVLEDVVLRMAHHAHELTGERTACLAGGVALNCVANERLLAEGPFDDVWVQPAAGDSGGAIGAALWGWHGIRRAPRRTSGSDTMRGAFLGPSYTTAEVDSWLDDAGITHLVVPDEELYDLVAHEISRGATVGWFRGRAEFGPRALGHRSILADPRDPTMVRELNMAVKGREGFRPFAPAVLEERAGEWFDPPGPSPYMLFTVKVREDRRVEPGPTGESFGDRLGAVRSQIPACTHLDHSARVQTVSRETNPDFHRLISAFDAITGCPVLINTSFNRAGEPVVCTPADALRCFAATALDVLVVENCVVRRDDLVRSSVVAA
jgi:carbamoyltransferase